MNSFKIMHPIKTIVVKFGGSIFSTSEEKIFDFSKALELRDFLRSFYSDYRFIVVVGGGYLARKYIQLLDTNSKSDFEQSKHEIGVASININAIMFRSLFSKGEVEEKIPRYSDFDDDSPLDFSKNVMVSAAGHPGHSSDYNALKLAYRTGTNTIFSLKNIDGVYDKDPKKFQDARRLDTVSWDEYLDIIGNPPIFTAGGNYPVDPITARKSKPLGIKFVIMSGESLLQFKNYIEEKKYIGTVIS